jgi:hypothetical protein
MGRLTLEASGSIFREQNSWFGAPALLRKHPAQFNLDPAHLCEELTYIIDGRTRFECIVAQGLRSVWPPSLPFYVYLGDKIYSTDGRKLLPKMLALAGHYDRAAETVPDPWRGSSLDVAAFLGLSQLEAQFVFAEIINDERLRQKEPPGRGKVDKRFARIVDRIRAGLLARSIDERNFELSDVAKLVDWNGPI